MSLRTTLATRLHRALMRRWLQARIRQLAQLNARPDLWPGTDDEVTRRLIACRMAALRGELASLETPQ